ncbi:acyl-CoA dehydrogenase family protein [Iodidimonas sp. SYSU 1G8]|uniref:acyl-CoA dehydrogenase family protein n=1 Tax=Iodidimonas sp. SYSU 1G8 TaxID=3133967 RepID=UPI0031FF2BD8
MDFTLNSEQSMLRDSARRYLAQAGGASWQGYADMGWLGIAAPEDAGGLGGGMAELAILTEEMGRALAPGPFIDGAVLATRLVDRLAASDARGALLQEMIAGTRRLVPALYEPGIRYQLTPRTHAARVGAGYRLSGTKVLVMDGAAADGLLVTASLEGGVGLFLVDREQPGIDCRTYRTVDGRDCADFRLDLTIPADRLLSAKALDAVEDALDEARLCLCADMLGGMDSAIEMTAEYLKTRTQFGQKLASFQALQHSVADLFIDADSVRSSVLRAIPAFSRGRVERQKAVSACWVNTFETAKRVTGMAVHLHGAIGFTTEYRVGHYLRRAIVSERRFGDVEFHLERYMNG